MSKFEAEIVVAYAKHNMIFAEVASELHYHYNTLKYHFNKIREKTGLNPRNFFDLGELYTMALEILEESDG